MDTKGGRYSLEIGGKIYSGRGTAKIMPSRVSLTAAPNMNGSGYNTVAPKLATLDLSFDRGVGIKWDEKLLLKSVNVTFKETDIGSAGITHLFTGASWNGDPTIDSATGEVTGLTLASDKYQQV